MRIIFGPPRNSTEFLRRLTASPERNDWSTGVCAPLGGLFNVAAWGKTRDLERLLLDTARVSGTNVQAFVMAATWLARYGRYLAKRRLAVLIREELGEEYQPVLGLLLEWVQSRNVRDR